MSKRTHPFKQNNLEIIATAVLVIGGAPIINACTSLHEHPMFQGAPAQTQTQSKADLPKLYTEAYVEFAGPADRWAGPPTWILHIKATNPPEYSITPALNAPAAPQVNAPLAEAPGVSNRVPAGVAAITQIGTTTAPTATTSTNNGPTQDIVRMRIAQLDQWTTPQAGDTTPSFHSCLSPVRVKLVRSDGIITERRGCRLQSSWSAQVSSLVSEFASYIKPN